MPVTVIRCSSPHCQAPAETKIAAPWKDGAFSELKTYGYACAQHVDAVIAHAQRRHKPERFSPGESVGPIGAYEMTR